MVSPKDKRRQELARFLKAADDFGGPTDGAAERTIWVILARHGTKEGATRAYKALWRRFVDINECRVANGTEIAEIIQRNVRNDAIVVAAQIRGFLRRFFKDQHTMDYGRTESMTNEQVKKYLGGIESHAREVALALFFHYCDKERGWQQEKAEAEAEDGKPKKRGERDVMQLLDRIKLVCAVAVHGTIPPKTKQAAAARQLVKSWAYAALPAPAPAKKAAKKAQAKKAAAKKKTAKKTTAKKAAGRGGGAARPRTARTSRSRATVKKSSRR